MLGFFTGKQEKQSKKVENDISDMFKTQLEKQFCQLCQKNPASKVAFGKQLKPVFTCSSCQLKAVGGTPQRLGHKNLISFDKFVQILTKQLISYETSIKNPPVQYKKSGESCAAIKNKAIEANGKILEQYKKMKKIVKDKQDKIIEQSLKQNNVLIFEQVNKMIRQKKMNQIDNGYLILKRALCNNKGLHFADEEAIERSNQNTNDTFAAIKKQSKVKLRPLEDLIDQINNVQLE